MAVGATLADLQTSTTITAYAALRCFKSTSLEYWMNKLAQLLLPTLQGPPSLCSAFKVQEYWMNIEKQTKTKAS